MGRSCAEAVKAMVRRRLSGVARGRTTGCATAWRLLAVVEPVRLAVDLAPVCVAVAVGFFRAVVLDAAARLLWAVVGVVVWAVTWACGVRNDRTPASAATNFIPEPNVLMRKPIPLFRL
jgi:hypothetical protein